MKYYLIGKNIETSLSPKIHNFLFKLKGRKPTYQQPHSHRLLSLKEMQEESFGGISITIPYKNIYKDQPLIEKRGEFCKKHGIANTVFKDQDRRLIAVNTDIFGIARCYASTSELQHKNALIIGAGATAQTFCGYFEGAGFKASLLNRSAKEELKQKFGNIVDFLPLKPQPIHFKTSPIYSTLVNTLPSEAVYEHWDNIEANIQNLFQLYPRNSRSRLVYMNVNYRISLDAIEQLLKKKLRLHVETLHGIDMLIWQAIQQNRHFCLQEQYNSQQLSWQRGKVRGQLGLP